MRQNTEGLVTWCNENNLSLNVGKTEELIIDFRKKGGEHAPNYINEADGERVGNAKFLGVTITDNLSWTSHVDPMVNKALQCLFFLRWLRKFGMSTRSLTNFYRCTIKGILLGCIMAGYGNCSAQDHKKLQKVVYTAETFTEDNLPTMDSIYMAHCTESLPTSRSHPNPKFNTSTGSLLFTLVETFSKNFRPVDTSAFNLKGLSNTISPVMAM
eukprot:g33859.t1